MLLLNSNHGLLFDISQGVGFLIFYIEVQSWSKIQNVGNIVINSV